MATQRMMKPSVRALAMRSKQQHAPIKHWTWDGLFLRRSCREVGDPACGQEEQQPPLAAAHGARIAGGARGEERTKEYHWDGLFMKRGPAPSGAGIK